MGEGENVEEALCQLISETVGRCGEIWERCHSEEEVRRLKDTQLEALMLQHNEVSQDNCKVVVEYLASGRQEANRKGMRCSDGQSLRTRGTPSLARKITLRSRRTTSLRTRLTRPKLWKRRRRCCATLSVTLGRLV